MIRNARGERAWLVAAALALPVGLYFALRAATSPQSALSVAFAAVPALLAARAFARPPTSWILVGVIIGIALAGIQGIGIVLAPIAAAAVLIEAMSRQSRSVFGGLVIIATSTAMVVVLVSAASVLYRTPT